MTVIEDFIKEYKTQYTEYDAIRVYAHKLLEQKLSDAGIMSIVTSRVKTFDRLQGKLIVRNKKEHYQSKTDIVNDIPDFIGLRIALYFPNDSEKIKSILEEFCNIVKIKKFPAEQKEYENYDRRFQGYCAMHYRIHLKNPPKSPLKDPIIEIQVASLLMHAWAEVEHDLAYKKETGNVSYNEYEALDEINGIVITGELALQRLYRLSDLRRKADNREFQNHFELASYLYEKVAKHQKRSDIYLGDVETLFRLLEHKNRLTVRKIDNELDKIDWDSTEPVTQQITNSYADTSSKDALLIFSNNKTKNIINYVDSSEQPSEQEIGRFLKSWSTLEKKLIAIGEKTCPNYPQVAIQRMVHSKSFINGILPKDMLLRYHTLRIQRNRIVHSACDLNNIDLKSSIAEVNNIKSFLDNYSPSV